MPEFTIKLGTKVQGKLFGPNALQLVGKLLEEIKEEVADYGVYLVKTRLGEVLRNPTGFYESHIQVTRHETDFMVTDQNMIYGPWLEGTSRRNAETSFPGYHTFRTVKRQLDQKKIPLAQPIVDRYVRNMNS